MTQISDGQLADRAIVTLQANLVIQDPWCLVGAGNAVQFNLSPCRPWGLCDFIEQLLGPAPQGDELDPHAVQHKHTEPGVGRELGVEDKLFRKPAGPLFPESKSTEDLISRSRDQILESNLIY